MLNAVRKDQTSNCIQLFAVADQVQIFPTSPLDTLVESLDKKMNSFLGSHSTAKNKLVGLKLGGRPGRFAHLIYIQTIWNIKGTFERVFCLHHLAQLFGDRGHSIGVFESYLDLQRRETALSGDQVFSGAKRDHQSV